nr:hypothetical protein [Tanacetum cinerariifolium]
LKDNPTQSSELLTKSSSTSLNSFLEETNTFHNSLPEFENFYFDLGEISSGSTTTHSDISLSEYESFIFEEFVDELAHIISPPEYDFFYFWNLPDPGELMSVLNFGIRENLSTTLVNLPIEDDYSPLLAYVVWIFVAYLTYPVIPPYLHPFGNEDTIFDPGITINHFYFKPSSSHRHEAFKKFNTHRSHLNEWPMIINGKNTPLLDVLFYGGRSAAHSPTTAAAAAGKATAVAAVGVAVVLVVSSGGRDDGVMEAAGGVVSLVWWCRLPWCVGEGGGATAEMLVVG